MTLPNGMMNFLWSFTHKPSAWHTCLRNLNSSRNRRQTSRFWVIGSRPPSFDRIQRFNNDH
eukprot:5429507-Amphidinium_carterae.1